MTISRLHENLITGAVVLIGATAVYCTYQTEGENGIEKDIASRIVLADITVRHCPDAAGAGTFPAARLVAPLAFTMDQKTGLSGAFLIQSTLRRDVSIAVCPDVQGDASFAVEPAPGTGNYQALLKINASAPEKAQQAAILQFLKAFNSHSLNAGAIIEADPALTQQMPGGLEPGVYQHPATLMRDGRFKVNGGLAVTIPEPRR